MYCQLGYKNDSYRCTKYFSYFPPATNILYSLVAWLIMHWQWLHVEQGARIYTLVYNDQYIIFCAVVNMLYAVGFQALGERQVKGYSPLTLQVWSVWLMPHGKYVWCWLCHWNCLCWNGPWLMRNTVSKPGIFQTCITTALLTDYGFWKFNHDIAYCTACRCRIVSPWIITKLMDCVAYCLRPAHWHCEWMACNTWYLIT